MGIVTADIVLWILCLGVLWLWRVWGVPKDVARRSGSDCSQLVMQISFPEKFLKTPVAEYVFSPTMISFFDIFENFQNIFFLKHVRVFSEIFQENVFVIWIKSYNKC